MIEKVLDRKWVDLSQVRTIELIKDFGNPVGIMFDIIFIDHSVCVYHKNLATNRDVLKKSEEELVVNEFDRILKLWKSIKNENNFKQ
jgi:hypothetical protein